MKKFTLMKSFFFGKGGNVFETAVSTVFMYPFMRIACRLLS